MRVTTNTFPDNLLSHLQRVTKDMNKLNEQVSTGQRISKVSEDSASANRILDMQEEKKRITQFAKNAARAENINNTTISQLQNFIHISDRISELATLADGLKGPDGMKAYAEEVDELLEHAMQGANAKFNVEYIFGGIDTGTEPFSANRDADGKIVFPAAGDAITYDGEAEGAEFHLSETGTIHPYTDGATNQQFADFINRLVALRDNMEAAAASADGTDPFDGTKNLLEGLEQSEDELIFALSRQGSVQMRIDFDLTLNEQRFTDLEENISAEADVDIAQTVVRLTQVQNAYQASLKSAGQVLNQSLLDYI